MGNVEQALQMIDAANARDPNLETAGREKQPKELVYGRRMSACLERLAPEASDLVRIAARAQHIERWTVPRASYPEGKKGYHRWRTDLGRFHADRAGEIMAACGYAGTEIEKVRAMLRKKNLRSDPDTQLLEDTICVVFLENYLSGFSAKHDPEKIVDILRKTWEKMSPRGREAALALELSEDARQLVERALAQ